MTIDIRSSAAAVPEDINDIIIDGSKVQSKVGHVAKFHQSHDDQISYDDELHSTSKGEIYQINLNDDQQRKNSNEIHRSKRNNNSFIGLTKEELKSYINNLYWKRIRWTLGIFYILLIILLIIGAILSVIFYAQCPMQRKLVWYEKEIIYEVDIQMFRDSNADGQGDIQGLQEKLHYFDTNFIKTILLQSTIYSSNQAEKFNLLTLNQQLVNETHLQNFIKILHRKDMHLMIDLPISSTNDLNGYQWYGDTEPLSQPIQNRCDENTTSLFCRYSQSYGRFPLDFNQNQIVEEAEHRLRYWLSTKKIDGVRVDLPLEFNDKTGLYHISYKTIKQWNLIKNDIERINSKTKLIFYNIPLNFNNDDFEHQIHYSILLQQQSFIDIQQFHQRIQNNHLSLPKFWQIGSNEQLKGNISKEFLLTIGMLLSGTPIILYGEEIALEQKSHRLMLWTPDKPCGGFSSCRTKDCLRLFSLFDLNLTQTNVKREEGIDGRDDDSFLMFFRYLSQLRQWESFQYGLLTTGYDKELNLFWFIREAPGHRGYLIVYNSNVMHHVSLYQLTNFLLPHSIIYEYQWPKRSLSKLNQTHINSDNFFLSSKSISIFSWKGRFVQSKIISQHILPKRSINK